MKKITVMNAGGGFTSREEPIPEPGTDRRRSLRAVMRNGTYLNFYFNPNPKIILYGA
jgi:hypothetical protein